MAKEAAEKEEESPEVQNEQTEETIENQTEESTEKTEPSLEQEVGELKDKYLRLYSEFENYRRRTAKEKIEFQFTANEKLILDLLPVLDDFERAQKSTEKTAENEAILNGIELVYQKLYKVLEQKGLKPIGAQGEVFDTELHEAVTQIPAPSEDLKGKVVDEIEKGYYLGEKVVRFSKVVIGS